MNAIEAKLAADGRKENDKASIPARVYSSIQDRATNGKRYLLCSSNKETRKQLKSDGFGCILLVNLTLVWW